MKRFQVILKSAHDVRPRRTVRREIAAEDARTAEFDFISRFGRDYDAYLIKAILPIEKKNS